MISPFGLRRLFGMLVLGARGGTRDQIVTALGLSDASDAAPSLPGFHVSDGMWIDRIYTTLPSFEVVVRSRFAADVAHVDFRSPDTMPSIERWVSQSTGGQIPSIPLSPGTTFVAADALTYRVGWAQPFEVGNTKLGPFHAADGTASVPMMHREVTAQEFGDAHTEYLRLPFTDGNSMLIALPDKGLTSTTLTDAMEMLDRQASPIDVALTLPRFTVSSHVELRDPLVRMGMTSSFNGDADYSAIFGRPGVALTRVFQQGAIAVDERGATMSVVSVAAVELGMRQLVTFNVDRPFAFVIEDNTTHQVLVAGIVAHP